jgi:hypothetical protein
MLGCANRAPQVIHNTSVEPRPSLSPSPTEVADKSAKYFDGSKACKFLVSVEGIDLGNYVAYTNTEGYTCEKPEPVIKLSCSPENETQCNQVSYSVGGEKEGATSAEVVYNDTPGGPMYMPFTVYPDEHWARTGRG